MGAVKRPKNLPVIDESEYPFTLPSSWSWARLGDVTNYGYSEKIEPSNLDKDTWVLELEDVEKITSRLLQKIRFKDRESKSTKNIFKSGDVIYGKLRPYLDKVIIASEDGVCTTEMIPIHSYYGIIPEYLRWVLKCPYFIDFANRSTHGMNLPRLGTDKARLSLIPIPPTPEQARIVAKVDELMALCDDLEVRKQKAHTSCIQLNNASIDKLLTAPKPEKFSRHWKRICDNFDLLYSKRENVNKLRQAILQLAIQGKLVPQDPNDEPASVLAVRIEGDIANQQKFSGIRTQPKLPPVDSNESPCNIPESWFWTKLGTISKRIIDGNYGEKYPKKDEFIESGIPFLTSATIGLQGQILPEKLKFISAKKHKELAKAQCSTGDVLLTNRGARVGASALLKDLQFKECNIGPQLTSIRTNNDLVSNRYVLLYLQSPVFQKMFRGTNTGSAMNFVNLTKTSNIQFPLPPTNEQKRIIAKVDRLMALCDDLENRLSQDQSDNNRLVEAAVADLLAA